MLEFRYDTQLLIEGEDMEDVYKRQVLYIAAVLSHGKDVTKRKRLCKKLSDEGTKRDGAADRKTTVRTSGKFFFY